MSKRLKRIILILLAGMAFFIYLVIEGTFFHIPTYYELERVELPQATEIYSGDSVLLGKMFSENRKSVSYNQIPKDLVNCLLSTEDVRFYEHNGIDFIGLIRAFVKTIILGENAGGGSTITQQLIKNWFPRSEYPNMLLITYKIREWVAAYRLEQLKEKKDILVYYLNTVPFGHNNFGIYTAAEYYFNKKPNELLIHEMATLIALLKGTSIYDPERHPDRCIERRNLVLRNVKNAGLLSEERYNEAIEEPLKTVSEDERPPLLAPFFLQHIRLKAVEVLADKRIGHRYVDPYTDGLTIYTSLDTKVQEHAETALKMHMDRLQQKFNADWDKARWQHEKETLLTLLRMKRYKGVDEIAQHVEDNEELSASQDSLLSIIKKELIRLRAGFTCISNAGEVLAWVGGRDFTNSQYDHVKSTRQVGSVFKPFVYTTAVDQGVNICNYFQNDQSTYSQYNDWNPENAAQNYGGFYTMKGALTYSLNVVSVQVLSRAGLSDVLNVANKMGISTNLPEVPSISLGTPDISLYEVVNAYTCYPNGGKRVQTRYIKEIVTSSGASLYQDPFEETKAVFSENVAAIMTNMMEAVVDVGTANILRKQYNLQGPIAGKTGTSQNHADGWFVGYTPKFTAGAWVGADSPGIHFKSLKDGAGSKTALPIWAEFAKLIEGDSELNYLLTGEFDEPSQEALNCLNQPLYRDKLE